MRYLVTGGAGFLGTALVKSLVSDGHDVRVFDDFSRGVADRLEDAAVDIWNGDVRDRDEVIEACWDMDSVVHMAYVNGTETFYERPDLVLEVAVKGMMNVIDGCVRYEVPELVVASSSEVYQEPYRIPAPENVSLVVPDPLNPRFSYGGGKILAELLALNYGLMGLIPRVLVFRPHNVYGPDMGNGHVIPQLIGRLQKHDPAKDGVFGLHCSEQATRSFIYVDDFVAGLRLVMEKGHHRGIYNIGTQDEISILKLARMLARIMGKDIGHPFCDGGPEGSVLRRCPDTTRLRMDLGFLQRVSLDEGLRKTVEWYTREGTL